MQAEKFLEFIFDQAPGTVGGLDGGNAFLKLNGCRSRAKEKMSRPEMMTLNLE